LTKGRVLAVEGAVLLILGAAFIVSGRLLGAAILLAIGMLAASCAWALWPTSGAYDADRHRPDHWPR